MAASQYMPVVFMHGLDGSHADGAALEQFLRKVHPGQRVELLTLNEKALSYESLLMKKNRTLYPDDTDNDWFHQRVRGRG